MEIGADRDDYVWIMWPNIQYSKQNWFMKLRPDQTRQYTSYDYASIMHSGSTYASSIGLPTIVPKVIIIIFVQIDALGLILLMFFKDPNAVIGQRVGLSDGDILRIQLMYNCPR